MTDDRPWSVPVRVDDIQASGRHIELDASSDVRAALAKPVGVVAIDRLHASFDVARRGRDGFRVSGEVSATVRQACVVTLEPLVNEINEPVAVDFAPVLNTNSNESNELELDADAPDEPEPLTGNSIDLGVVAIEFLILGVDPYPRKGDAAFTVAPDAAPAPAEGDAAGHPFAALAALKKTSPPEE
jgi:hypothetical protein